jgi:hypothetical protein
MTSGLLGAVHRLAAGGDDQMLKNGEQLKDAIRHGVGEMIGKFLYSKADRPANNQGV